jgi:GNAT superfamily N-acetyltransferase
VARMVDPPSEGGVRVRVARTDELAALAALVERSFRALGAGHYAAGALEASLGRAIRVDPGLVADGTYFAAELDGALCGCGGWSAKIATAPGAPLPSPRAEVRAMFVLPEYQGRGVGQALLRAAEGAIAAAGYGVAYLLATRSGLAFYLRAGYTALGEYAIALPGGEVLEVTCMQRGLDHVRGPA